MKKSYIKVQRISRNQYIWESKQQDPIIINQTQLLLMIGGVMAATLAEGMEIDEEVNIDMRKEKIQQW